MSLDKIRKQELVEDNIDNVSFNDMKEAFKELLETCDGFIGVSIKRADQQNEMDISLIYSELTENELGTILNEIINKNRELIKYLDITKLNLDQNEWEPRFIGD